MNQGNRIVKYLGWLSLCCICIGCGTTGGTSSPPIYVGPDGPTPIGGPVEAQDIISCADELSRDLLGTPEIVAATPYCRMALRQIKNMTPFRLDTNIITSNMRHDLMEYCGGRIRFVERTRGGKTAEFSTDVLAERDLKREGIVDSGRQKPLAGVDFFLKGEIRSHSVVVNRGRDDTIWYYCWLVDTETSELIWEHRYGPIRKVSMKGKVYR